ncbi:MAG TPA: DUF2905 domain-containing protein [Bacteroidota bacterium]|nr:DUF2905 domain-containing protein [Bacteroidota bacterium]
MITSLGKVLVLLGIVITGIGFVMMFSDKIPFLGRLPGDISVKRENFQVYIPITTSILISVAASVILWLISLVNKK